MNHPDSHMIEVSLSPPSLSDNTADADRLFRAVQTKIKTGDVVADLALVRRLPGMLRLPGGGDAPYRYADRARCLFFPDGGPNAGRHLLLWLSTDPDEPPPLGLAVDLGTSRIVLRLLDLETGQALGETAFDNPQKEVGPDVLVRIHHADRAEGADRLRQLVAEGINAAARTLCEAAGAALDRILLCAVAGNTAMTHLFLGLPPRWIIREPYIPAANRPGLLRASELGLAFGEGARVFILPNVGSYFGGDLIAGILFSGIADQEETALLVDVGTNAEVVLGNRHWLMACAGAAGPALEGGVTKMGMMAGPGVVDRVRIDPATKEFSIRTIENAPAVGICGSGLIDLAAQGFLAGMIDIRGRLVPEACGGRAFDVDGLNGLMVALPEETATGEAISITQADLDSLVRSKAAMFTILETLTQAVGLSFGELSDFYVAGTFGSFIDPESAIAIGMIPDLPRGVYKPLGNSSLGGAALVLTDPVAAARIDELRDRITYMELNVNQDFMNRFSAAKFLPHTDPSRFPTVKR